MRTEIPLLTQFDAAFVVNAPMFTVTVVTGLSAAVQFKVTAGLAPVT